VVDVRTGTLEPDQTLIIERKHIVSAGPSKSAKYPPQRDDRQL